MRIMKSSQKVRGLMTKDEFEIAHYEITESLLSLVIREGLDPDTEPITLATPAVIKRLIAQVTIQRGSLYPYTVTTTISQKIIDKVIAGDKQLSETVNVEALHELAQQVQGSYDVEDLVWAMEQNLDYPLGEGIKVYYTEGTWDSYDERLHRK